MEYTKNYSFVFGVGSSVFGGTGGVSGDSDKDRSKNSVIFGAINSRIYNSQYSLIGVGSAGNINGDDTNSTKYNTLISGVNLFISGGLHNFIGSGDENGTGNENGSVNNAVSFSQVDSCSNCNFSPNFC